VSLRERIENKRMETFLEEIQHLRLLVCSNVDEDSVSKLVEKYVPHSPQFDAIVVIGPFNNPSKNSASTSEEGEACRIADITTIVAQLEHITCRVLYLPSQKEPLQLIVEEAHLTPNSLGIHGRHLSLLKNLSIFGFSETDHTQATNLKSMVDEENIEEIYEDISVQSGQSAVVIKDILSLSPNSNEGLSGIFVLQYHFAHTLNSFLFHMQDELQQAGIELCIISSTIGEETSRLPKRFGNLSIAALGSLVARSYCIINLELQENTNKWKTISVEHMNL
jgi:hypothetical protein